ncbi:hypothetical protein [Haladaptatus sp. DYSN1]|uniref:DUF7269 family protein n=1 Tax=unclassified Haladaptatus TaxID=2622732 RepID=UPI0024059B2C|nr:hypothetical protein [Haladaptatus sp. DYSN1]
MTFRRFFFGVLGVVAFVGGYLATTNPSIASAIPVGTLVALLGNDYLVLVVVALVAVLLTLAVTVSARNGARDHTTPPEAEEVTNVPLAGDHYDDLFTNSGLWALTHREERTAAYEQLKATTTRLVQSEMGCTKAEAEDRIDRGTWTDDPYAAHFLGSQAPSPGILRRLSTLVRFETLSQRGARHTAAEIVRRTGGGGRAA